MPKEYSRPGNVFAIGANHKSQAPVSKLPSFFSMPASSVATSPSKLLLPEGVESVAVEGELGVIFSKAILSGASRSSIKESIFGWVLLNDLSARSENIEYPPLLKKGSRGFLVLSPGAFSLENPQECKIDTYINEKLQCSLDCRDYFSDPYSAIEKLSSFVAIEPGDLLCLGCHPEKPKAFPGDRIKIVSSELGEIYTEIAV